MGGGVEGARGWRREKWEEGGRREGMEEEKWEEGWKEGGRNGRREGRGVWSSAYLLQHSEGEVKVVVFQHGAIIVKQRILGAACRIAVVMLRQHWLHACTH